MQQHYFSSYLIKSLFHPCPLLLYKACCPVPCPLLHRWFKINCSLVQNPARLKAACPLRKGTRRPERNAKISFLHEGFPRGRAGRALRTRTGSRSGPAHGAGLSSPSSGDETTNSKTRGQRGHLSSGTASPWLLGGIFRCQLEPKKSPAVGEPPARSWPAASRPQAPEDCSAQHQRPPSWANSSSPLQALLFLSSINFSELLEEKKISTASLR